MKQPGSYYRQFIPGLDISFERGTNGVPDDGKFHIVSQGTILQSFHSQKKGIERFRQLVKESGYKSDIPQTEPSTLAHEGIERFLDDLEMYQVERYKHRTKRGRGGRGGV